MVRTRFAPSPTGFLHIGGLRTALYSFLWARKHKGQFILRIEDTDVKRYVEGATENLINTLHAVGLDYDEGPHKDGPHTPYFQSKRTHLYQQYAEELLDNGKAYRCFCTEERLKLVREEQMRRKLPPMYDRHCLILGAGDINQKIQNKEPFVIRQRIPQNQTVTFYDHIRGKMSFNSNTLDDLILLKSDKQPTYHLANVVDDHLMEITHVIRGEEWLPSTPKHALLYEAFGWTPPEFAHIPLLLNPDKSKLSKRQGDVAAEDYLKKGYLPEALINFITLLGWNPGSEQEVFTLKELINQFSLDRVQKAGAIFNREKLDWFNGLYIRKLSLDELLERIIPFIKEEVWFNEKIPQENREYLKQALSLEKQRLTTLAQAKDLLKLFFVDLPEYELSLLCNGKMEVNLEMAKKAFDAALPLLEKSENFDDQEKSKDVLIKLIKQMGIKNGQLLWPIRVALSGQSFSPGVFELMRVLGKKRVLARIKHALDKLKA